MVFDGRPSEKSSTLTDLVSQIGMETVCGVGGSVCGCVGGERRWRCEMVDKDDNGVTKEVDGAGGEVMATLGMVGCCR